MPANVNSRPPDEWPAHWIRPTAADLQLQQESYARGFVPPHSEILHRPARELVVGSAACNETVEALYDAADKERLAGKRPLVGLAAPQIGRDGRAFLFDPREDPPVAEAAPELCCVINPVVVPEDAQPVKDFESCMSAGRYRGVLVRPDRVRLTGMTPQGDQIDNVWSGRPARVIQHEVDHLDGIIFVDKTPDDNLWWVPVEGVAQYVDNLKRMRSGEEGITLWHIKGPRDQWDAIKAGVPVFGEFGVPL